MLWITSHNEIDFGHTSRATFLKTINHAKTSPLQPESFFRRSIIEPWLAREKCAFWKSDSFKKYSMKFNFFLKSKAFGKNRQKVFFFLKVECLASNLALIKVMVWVINYQNDKFIYKREFFALITSLIIIIIDVTK